MCHPHENTGRAPAPRGRAPPGPFRTSTGGPPRDQYDEHPVAPRDRALDDLAVVRRSRNDSDSSLELVELLHTALAAHANHLVDPIQRVLHHVPPELPRGTDDADPHWVRVVFAL